eukprot:TRINITY_DN767_c0_g1_i1.p4 TRINITY_DN767_c0_g1~~TRINITY_DN767_c0_g1_i1.p4  ORF type:complete len:266 (-),score=32.56 TRINITY_DN767_c0_g1_i1:3317-4003(-)
MAKHSTHYSTALVFALLIVFVGAQNRCPKRCNDNPPEPDEGEYQYSCQDQKDFGQCGADFMKGYCECTCGTCGAKSSAVPIAIFDEQLLTSDDGDSLDDPTPETPAATTPTEPVSGDTPLEPYPFLQQMSCTDLLSIVRMETLVRYELQVYDLLDDLIYHEDVQQCISGIDRICDSSCCDQSATSCVCNRNGKRCQWKAVDDVSIPYANLFIFENQDMELCRCKLEQE